MQQSDYDIDVEDLSEMRTEGRAHAVLDIREPAEVAICVLSDSIVVPMQQVPDALETLPRDTPLVVLCHHGMRSAMVTNYLRGNGFDNAWNLQGGIDAWARLIDTQMARY